MVSFDEICCILNTVLLIGALIFMYLVYRNRGRFEKESNELFDELVREHPTLQKTDAHATYVNLCGKYKGFPIFVSHARGKGAVPQRMRFYFHHNVKFNNDIRVFDKKFSLLKSVQSGFKKELIPVSNETTYLFYYLSENEKAKPIFMDANNRLNSDKDLFALTCDNFGIEIQFIGYIHDKQKFIRVLDNAVNLIEELGKNYAKLDPILETTVMLTLSDTTYNKIYLHNDIFLIYSNKGPRKYNRNDILFIYQVEDTIEIYNRNADKINLSRENTHAMRSVLAWML
ncbi:MAG: hypothetical protein ACFFG0_35825 [Candidatus Thorarchaeota archaeon]